MMNWTRAIFLEVFAIVHAVAARLIPCPATTLRSGNGQPLLLVHGYCNNAWVWVFLKRKLARAGLGPIYLINLGYPFRSLHTYAQRVEAKADEIARETGKRDLTLVGHSMGGLVAALYALRTDRVCDVVMIASPIEGTPLASFAPGPNAREMQKGSPLLKELGEQMDASDIRFHQIATHCDQLVIPGISAGRKVPVERRLILNNVGHAGLLFSPRVARYLIAALSPSTVI